VRALCTVHTGKVGAIAWAPARCNHPPVVIGRPRSPRSPGGPSPQMLVLRGARDLGEGRLEVRAALGRAWSAVVIRKSGLLFDTRFVPPERAPTVNELMVFVSEGTFELLSPARQLFQGPAVLSMTEAAFEGAGGRRTVELRTFGPRFSSLQLRLPPGALIPAAGEPREILGVTDAIWSAVRRTIEVSDGTLPEHALDVLTLLAERGLVRADRIVSPPDAGSLLRLASAALPTFERLDALSTAQALAASAGVSLRTLARELRGFFDTVPFVGRSFRDVALRSRFKLVVHALSAEELRIAEVATLCGYGSTEAMARAFRDAGLPSPSNVRRLLREDPTEAPAAGPASDLRSMG
jgi:AraC-like DNA-binding protein